MEIKMKDMINIKMYTQLISKIYNVQVNKEILKHMSKYNYSKRKSTIKEYLQLSEIDIIDNNIDRAFCSLICMLSHKNHNTSHAMRTVGYNVVMTQLINSKDSISYVYDFVKNKGVLHTEDSLVIASLQVNNGIITDIFDEIYISPLSNKGIGLHIDTHQKCTELDKQNKIKFLNKTYIGDLSKETFAPASDYLYLYKNSRMFILLNESAFKDEIYKEKETYLFQNGVSYMSQVHNMNNISNNIIKGKDWIKEYFYKPSTGYLYFLKLDINGSITYKVGITKNDKTRFSSLPDNIKIIDSIYYEGDMLVWSIIERYFHKKFYSIKDTNIMEVDFAGKTECYINNIHNYYIECGYNNILEESLNSLDNEGYPLDSHIIKYKLRLS